MQKIWFSKLTIFFQEQYEREIFLSGFNHSHMAYRNI
jgi:hypothetical protein